MKRKANRSYEGVGSQGRPAGFQLHCSTLVATKDGASTASESTRARP